MSKSAYLVVFTDGAGNTADAGIFSTPYPKMTPQQLARGIVTYRLLDQEDPMMAGTKGAWAALLGRTARQYGALFGLPTLAAQLQLVTIADAYKRAGWATAGYDYASRMEGSPRGPLGFGPSMISGDITSCPSCGTASVGGCMGCGGKARRNVQNAALLAMLAVQSRPAHGMYPRYSGAVASHYPPAGSPFRTPSEAVLESYAGHDIEVAEAACGLPNCWCRNVTASAGACPCGKGARCAGCACGA